MLKRSVPKLVSLPPLPEPFVHQIENPCDRRALFAGDGHGPFIDKLIAEAGIEMQAASGNIDDICRNIEQRIKSLHAEYKEIFHPGYMPVANLTYGIWCGTQTRLFYAYGPIVNNVGKNIIAGGPPVGYVTSGSGSDITNYIADRMQTNTALHTSEAIILAAYMLQQAVSHADGCGGDIHIAVLRNDGTTELIDVALANLVRMLKELDSQLGTLLLKGANWKFSDKSLDRIWEHLKTKIQKYKAVQNEIVGIFHRDEQEFQRLVREIAQKTKIKPKKN